MAESAQSLRALILKYSDAIADLDRQLQPFWQQEAEIKARVTATLEQVSGSAAARAGKPGAQPGRQYAVGFKGTPATVECAIWHGPALTADGETGFVTFEPRRLLTAIQGAERRRDLFGALDALAAQFAPLRARRREAKADLDAAIRRLDALAEKPKKTRPEPQGTFSFDP